MLFIKTMRIYSASGRYPTLYNNNNTTTIIFSAGNERSVLSFSIGNWTQKKQKPITFFRPICRDRVCVFFFVYCCIVFCYCLIVSLCGGSVCRWKKLTRWRELQLTSTYPNQKINKFLIHKRVTSTRGKDGIYSTLDSYSRKMQVCDR